ncbi:MAG: hypothetical protein WD907_06640, partial [Bacilli bacterium]
SYNGFSVDTVYDINILGLDENGKLSITANVEAKAGRDKASFRIVELLIDQGEVEELQFVSSPYTFTKTSTATSTKDGNYLVWLEKSEEVGYDVKIGSTSTAFNQYVNHVNMDMFIHSVYTVINSFILSLITIAITSFWATPGLVIVMIVEWRKSEEWIEKHIMSVLGITAIVTVLFEIAFIRQLFFKPAIMPYMPEWLNFGGSFIVIPIIVALLTFLATTIYRRSMEIPSFLGLFTFFMVSNLVLLDLMFAPYML